MGKSEYSKFVDSTKSQPFPNTYKMIQEVYKGIQLLNVAEDVDTVLLYIQVTSNKGDVRRTPIISERSKNFTNYINFTNIGAKVIFKDNEKYDFTLLM